MAASTGSNVPQLPFIPLARPTLGEEELASQARVLGSGRLVLGPENEAFALAVARAAGRPHAIAVSSGTAALHAALWALDLPHEDSDEIIVPGFTFPAPAHAARVLGLRVVAADVDAHSWNLSPAAVARSLTRKTVAILAVDQFGLPADHAALGELARQARVPLVEDAACAIGAALGGQPAGSFGAAACFSFHPRKVVTTGEGGAVVVSDPELAKRVRGLRNHGLREPGRFAEAALNLRMSEMAAALGQVQLGRLDTLLRERAARVAAYQACLGARPRLRELTWQRAQAGARHSWQTFAVLLPAGTDRARVVAGLRERGVEAGQATYALHRIGSFAGQRGFSAAVLPVSDALHDRALALPLFGGMTDADVERVVAALEESLR